MYDKMKHLI